MVDVPGLGAHEKRQQAHMAHYITMPIKDFIQATAFQTEAAQINRLVN